MKRFSFTLFVILIALTTGFAQKDIKTTGAYSCFQRKSSMKELPYLPSYPGTAGPHAYDVIKYTINANIRACFLSPYPTEFKASVKIQFRADSVISNIKLNAVNFSLQIDSVRLAGVSFSHSADILTVTLDHIYSPGQVAEIMIYYKHKSVLDNAFYASGGFVYTDCEPEGARHWFPCYDSPSDKALLDLTAQVPTNAKLGSNGRLADSTIVADTLTYHWVSANNIATYLMVMTGKVNYKLDIVYYHKVTNPADSVPMRFYYNNGEYPYPQEDLIDSMAAYYSRNWCEHPFEKNGFATLNPQFYWGGMENQTLTSFCPGCWETSLMAHEFAHQWYGDMITCATWADIWLNEGFASWAEGYWDESSGGYTAYIQSMQSYAGSYLQGNPGWAISEPDWAVNTPSVNTLFDWSITYCKGACALHQLRYTIGDSLFFQVLKTYCADTNYKYKSATIPNFNQIVNNVTGANYDWFFNEWIYTPNHPVYANTYQFKNLGSGSWQVDFNARQVQTNAPFFKMPLEIRIAFADYTDTIVRFMNSDNNELFSFYFSKQPTSVFFDPNSGIVLKAGSTIVGVPENADRSGVVLGQNSPNPAGTRTSISFILPVDSDAGISIINPLGVKVWQSLVKSYTAGVHNIVAELGTLPNGIYIYTLTTGGRNYSKKLVVNR